MKRLLIVLLAVAATSAQARGRVVFAGGAWAAIERDNACEALSRSLRVAPKDKVQAVAGITFAADRRRGGEFHARLSRMPRGDASVMLQVGDQPFLLVTRGGWAWSRGPLQAQAIIDALRSATSMSVASRGILGGFAFPTRTYSTGRRPRSMRQRRGARSEALAKSPDRT